MATEAKRDDLPLPLVVLTLFLALAFAAGGLEGVGGGHGGSSGGGQPAPKDPCHDKGAHHIVRSWFTSQGIVYLRCGTEAGNPGGYRHIEARRIKERDSLDDVLECIGRAISRGEYEEQSTSRGVQRVYRWKWGTRSGNTALVRVMARTGNVITAVPGRGYRWDRCAGR